MESVIEIIAEEMEKRIHEITEDKTLVEIGIDWVDLIYISIRIDEKFDIDTEEDEMAKWETIKDIIKYVEEKIG